jgi:hypothetical protein
MLTMIRIGTAALAAVAASAVAADDPSTVPYPDGYRMWTHVASSVTNQGPQSGTIHNIYANAAALEGYRTGRFANGSIIVGDLLRPRAEGFMNVSDSRIRVAVMHKDSARYAATGGWGFQQFRGDSRTDLMVVADSGAARCFSCHSTRTQSGFVFSTWH